MELSRLLSLFILSIAFVPCGNLAHNGECHCAECCYSECHVDLFFIFKTCQLSAIFIIVLVRLKTQTAAVILHVGLVAHQNNLKQLIQNEELQLQFGF